MNRMTNNHLDPLWSKKTTIPIKLVGDRWEFFYGGQVPVKDGTIGELTISTNQISDPKFLQRVTTTLKVKVLDQGTSLLVALSDRSKNGSVIDNWPTPWPLNVPPGTTRWVEIKLGSPSKGVMHSKTEATPESGGLWITVKGLERCELTSSTIDMPEGITDRSVKSLNHALTLLSQTYEKHRISNTGNVYARIFYQDKDNCWYPLDDLRSGVQAKKERQLLNETWAEIEKALGWRPVSMPKRTRK